MKDVAAAGSLIPREWVGLPPAPGSPAGSAARAGASGAPRGDGTGARDAIGSLLASPSSAVVELVTPVSPAGERGGCFIERGRPCTGSGRCRQRGY